MDEPKTLAEFAELHGELDHRERSIVRLAAAVEREACAKIAEAPAWSAPTATGEWALREVAKVIAIEIRARSAP